MKWRVTLALTIALWASILVVRGGAAPASEAAVKASGQPAAPVREAPPLQYRALTIDALRQQFANPPSAARPTVFWFWFGNHVWVQLPPPMQIGAS